MFIKKSFIVFSLFLFSFFARAGSVDIRLDVKFASLYQLNDLMSYFPSSNLLVSGHTDSRGADVYNADLSIRRAQAVKKALTTIGLAPSRIETKGFGEAAPIADNELVEGRAKNRRVVASLLGLSNNELNKVPSLINSNDYSKRLVILETESDIVAAYKKELAPEPEPEPLLRSEPTVEVEQPKAVTILKEKHVSEEPQFKYRKRKKRRAWYLAGYLGPHWDSSFYGDDVVFEHGRFNILGLGVDAGFKLSKKWFLDGYFYYLPTQINEGSSSVEFREGSSVKYENNIYGLRAGYTFKGGKTYRLSAIAGLQSHILGGVERSGVNDYQIEKFTHNGLGLGLRLEKKLTKKWVLDSDLAYILPLSISGVDKADGALWYRGILGVKRQLKNKRCVLSLEYQIVYHESDFEFKTASQTFRTRPEFLVQTLMIGLKYNFKGKK
jgi:hypothetical protein